MVGTAFLGSEANSEFWIFGYGYAIFHLVLARTHANEAVEASFGNPHRILVCCQIDVLPGGQLNKIPHRPAYPRLYHRICKEILAGLWTELCLDLA